MHIELKEMDLGFKKAKRAPKLSDFGVQCVSYYYSTADGFVEAGTDNFDPAATHYVKADALQWALYVDGEQWGYVSKKNNGHVPLIRRVDDETKDKLLAAIRELVGERSQVCMPPDISHLLEDEDDDDDAGAYEGSVEEDLDQDD